MTQILSPLNATGTRACEEREALSLLTDDQVVQSFIRAVQVTMGGRLVPSLHGKDAVAAYVDAIYAKVNP